MLLPIIIASIIILWSRLPPSLRRSKVLALSVTTLLVALALIYHGVNLIANGVQVYTQHYIIPYYEFEIIGPGNMESQNIIFIDR